MSSSTLCCCCKGMGRWPGSCFSYFSNKNENIMLSMTRNKTETKRVCSIYSSRARRDQQLHFSCFCDLLLFFPLSMVERPRATGTAWLTTANPRGHQGTEWQKQIMPLSLGHPLWQFHIRPHKSGFVSVTLWPVIGQHLISSGSKGSGEGGLSALQEQKSAGRRHRDVCGGCLLLCLSVCRNSKTGFEVAAVWSMVVRWLRGA